VAAASTTYFESPIDKGVKRRRGGKMLHQGIEAAIIGVALGSLLYALQTNCYAWGSLACAQIFFIEVAADTIGALIVLFLILGGVVFILWSRKPSPDE